ncbi:hypothetical protein VIGAN_01325700 [Vigna angularis var. angularis]|uniref:Uncharacterized protein n=1 Tax=Vigna angularis var. angularis TaxID=157739 RepID=A0A0S3R413_PHAAN|nr:hypothetical protein VIGAN_01325700 [Vigna angularis var. angularis]
MMLNVANNSSFRDRAKGQNISNYESGFLATVYELTGIKAFGSNEELVLLLVSEWVAESHLGKWGTAARVVNDVGNDTLEVAIPLPEVQAPEASRSLAVVGVGLED